MGPCTPAEGAQLIEEFKVFEMREYGKLSHPPPKTLVQSHDGGVYVNAEMHYDDEGEQLKYVMPS